MNIPEEAKLTPEEIYNIYHKAKDKELSTSKAIADAASEKAYKAGIEKVVRILHYEIKRKITKEGEIVVFTLPSEIWQALLKELETEDSTGISTKGIGKGRKMTERNEFDNALRDLAIRHAPKQIVKCGDVVTASWAWKKPHKVLITSVAVEVSDIGLTIGRRAELGLTGWLIVQHQYIGRRLKSSGELAGNPATGFLLSEFTTSDGQKFERIPSGFNHVGLVFEIESSDAPANGG